MYHTPCPSLPFPPFRQGCVQHGRAHPANLHVHQVCFHRLNGARGTTGIRHHGAAAIGDHDACGVFRCGVPQIYCFLRISIGLSDLNAMNLKFEMSKLF